MEDLIASVAALAAELIAIDSRSGVSNLPIATRIERELSGFALTRLDYVDAEGVAKRALIAHRGPSGGYALAAHMDTVPPLGWQSPPFEPRLVDGVLHGLGAVDMKGPLAACLVAARRMPPTVPVTLLLTTDEETNKEGARRIAAAEAARQLGLKGIIVAEPTALTPVRGHRSHIEFVATATGVQAHSATGQGVNANWALIPFLNDMRLLHQRLRTEPAWQDPAYDPPFCDFNLVIDNHGSALNVTVPKATARIKFRRSRRIDSTAIAALVRVAAERAGVALSERDEGPPPELPPDHPLVQRAVEASGTAATTAPFGTDACLLQALAPCVVLGPGKIETAHTPRESVAIADLAAAVAVFQRILAAG